MKKTPIFFASFFLIIFLGLTFSWLHYLFTPALNKEVVYYLKPGTSRMRFVNELTQQHIISAKGYFAFYLYSQIIFSDKHAHLKTGEYLFPIGSTPISIVKQVTNGTGLFYRPFTIVPGWTFTQLRQTLTQTPTFRHVLQALNTQQLMGIFGNQHLSPEGQFYPDTYHYTRNVPDLIILKRAFALMQSHLQKIWRDRDILVPYKNPYDMLIAASLIEKEAYLKKEMPIIAGVLVNRLNKDMLLQFDPTVIYGMGTRYTGKIFKSDLEEDTAYNTYLHKGLPPTPIAFPSLAAIDAAAHPMKHEYYYFVAKGNGEHQFSKTLVEHNKAVQLHTNNQYFNYRKVIQYIFAELEPYAG
jgi:peptidoglycan lytic transglycosylase G